MRCHKSSGVHLGQCRTLVHRDVVCLVALDFVLWIIRARVMRVSLVIEIFRMDLDDLARNVPSLRIPADVIADFETSRHDGSLQFADSSMHSAFVLSDSTPACRP